MLHVPVCGGPSPWLTSNRHVLGQNPLQVLDPYALDSLFSDSAATQAATQTGSPIGTVLDQSGNALHAIQTADPVNRPMLGRVGGRRWISFEGDQDSLQTQNWPFSTHPYVAVALSVEASPVAYSHLVEVRGTNYLDNQHRQPLIYYGRDSGRISVNFGSHEHSEIITPQMPVILQAWITSSGDMGFALNGTEQILPGPIALTDGGPVSLASLGSAGLTNAFQGRLYGAIFSQADPGSEHRASHYDWLSARISQPL